MSGTESEKQDKSTEKYKTKLRSKSKITKPAKYRSQTDAEKSYDTDEPAGGACSRSRRTDRAYESDVVCAPNVGYQPPPLTLTNPNRPPSKDAAVVSNSSRVMSQADQACVQRMIDAGLFEQDAEERGKSKEGGLTKRVSRTELTKEGDATITSSRPRAATPTPSERPRSVGSNRPKSRTSGSHGARSAVTSAVQTPASSDVQSDGESLRSAKSRYSSRSERSSAGAMGLLSTIREEISSLKRAVYSSTAVSKKKRSGQVDRPRDTSAERTEWATAAATSCDEVVRDQMAIEAAIRANRPNSRTNQNTAPSSRGGRSAKQGEQSVRPSCCVHAVAGAGAPGGGDDGDDGDSDRDANRRAREQHFRDAAKRRAARVSDNPEAAYPPSVQPSTSQAMPETNYTTQPSRTIPLQSGSASQWPINHLTAPFPPIGSHTPMARQSNSTMPTIPPFPVAAAPARIHIEQVRLPTFSGEELPLFLRQFESIAVDSAWGEETKARKLMECLEGKTRRHVDETMNYQERVQALKQMYGGSKPSAEAKNLLRNFRKGFDETIEAYAARIMEFVDECHLSDYDKRVHMQMAFMNGLRYDCQMQRYIEKHTGCEGAVPIVKLLAAAQQYMQNKTGSSSIGGKGNKKRDFNQHSTQERNQPTNHSPQLQVMKNGRKEPLTHADPTVTEQVEQEQHRAQQERAEKANARAAATRKELEELQNKIQALEQAVQQAQANANANPQTPAAYGRQDGYSRPWSNNRGGRGRGQYYNGYGTNGYQNNSNYNRGNGYGQGYSNNHGGYRQPYNNRGGSNDRGGYQGNYNNRNQAPLDPPAARNGQAPNDTVAQHNQHQMPENQPQECVYPGNTYSVFPENSVYVSSGNDAAMASGDYSEPAGDGQA